jgi:hypothetical protein
MENKKNKLRNFALSGLVAITLATATSCGWGQKILEQDLNYKTLVGRTGHVTFYLGNGDVEQDFPNARIIYSSSDSRCLWIKSDGNEYYWQGDAKVKLDN